MSESGTERPHLEALLPDSADLSESDFGDLQSGWYANILFTDGWIHPETLSRLREAGWFIEDAYRYGDEGLIVRVERSLQPRTEGSQ